MISDCLQGEIDNIHSMQSQDEEQPFDLVEQTKAVQSEFITQIKADIYKLIEIESKLSTEKNIYEKSESEKIEYAKEQQSIQIISQIFMDRCILRSIFDSVKVRFTYLNFLYFVLS